MRMYRALAPAAAVLGLAAAPAAAATVELRAVDVQDHGGSTHEERHARIVAASGEANRLHVDVGADLVVSDTGAALQAGEGCVRDGAGVRCAGPLDQLEVESGEGDDTVTIDPTLRATYVFAGPGDDVVRGASWASGEAGADRLTGGPDRDVLSGGGGPDRLEGLGGDDGLAGGDDRAADVLDGGAGADTADYSERAEPLLVDLAAGTGGAAGEDDALARIERVTGGGGADALRGSGGSDALDGGPDRDVLEGRGGDDALAGWAGDDLLDGGSGADSLMGGYGNDRMLGGGGDDRIADLSGRDRFHGGAGDDALTIGRGARGARISCGPGTDLASAARARVEIAPDCEAVGPPWYVMLDRPRVERPR